MSLALGPGGRVPCDGGTSELYPPLLFTASNAAVLPCERKSVGVFMQTQPLNLCLGASFGENVALETA